MTASFSSRNKVILSEANPASTKPFFRSFGTSYEVPKLLKKGLVEAGFASDKITLFLDEKEAVNAGLNL